MSSRTRKLLLRLLSPAGPLTAMMLAATPTVHGQDGARALHNQVGQTSAPAPSLAASELPAALVSGERALLGVFGAGFIPAAPQVELLASDTVAQLIDGARALMGGPATTAARRRNLSTNQ